MDFQTKKKIKHFRPSTTGIKYQNPPSRVIFIAAVYLFTSCEKKTQQHAIPLVRIDIIVVFITSENNFYKFLM